MFTRDAGDVFADPTEAAEAAGLRYVSDETTPGIRRKRRGKGFQYRSPSGASLRDTAELRRIRALAIPPAWTNVWIAADGRSHILATGRDARGRKQYRYNPEFIKIRDAAKFGHLVTFAESLPKIRQAVRKHVARRTLSRERVLATIVSLLDRTHIRIGNDEYAQDNGSFGLTTLRNRHVRTKGERLQFLFHGKGGKVWQVELKDKRVARVIRECQELPGQQLFEYVDAAGAVQRITSGDVNDWLRTITNRDITAKDFRTWAATVAAAALLNSRGAVRKSHIAQVLKQVAAKLRNTPAICRKCYVHPGVLDAGRDGTLSLRIVETAQRSDLDGCERAVLRFLKRYQPRR